MFFLVPFWNRYDNNLDYNVIINLAKMMKREKVDFTFLCLTFLPMLNYQINKYGLPIHYIWNVFDDIQGINTNNGCPLGIEDLNFDPELERVYSYNSVSILKEEKVFAFVEMFDNKIINKITRYSPTGEIKYADYLDSRGFISRRRIYQNNILEKVIFFSQYGENILEVDAETNKVKIILEHKYFKFKKICYNNMNELILEVLHKKLERIETNFRIISPIGEEILPITTNIQKYYDLAHMMDYHTHINDGNRFFYKDAVEKASTLVATSKQQKQELVGLFSKRNNDFKKLKVVSPFNAVFNFGKSNSTKYQIIFWYVREMSVNRFENILQEIINIILKKKFVKLECNVVDVNLKQKGENFFKKQIQSYFNVEIESSEFQFVIKYLELKDEQKIDERMKDKAITLKKKNSSRWKSMVEAALILREINFSVNNTVDYYNEIFSETRIFIDLSIQPNIYLQIKSISYGVPQINMNSSEFMTDHENGLVLKEDEELNEKLLYYLESMRNWNESLIYSVKKIEDFSSQSLLKKL